MTLAVIVLSCVATSALFSAIWLAIQSAKTVERMHEKSLIAMRSVNAQDYASARVIAKEAERVSSSPKWGQEMTEKPEDKSFLKLLDGTEYDLLSDPPQDLLNKLNS
jgi:hypothetical protein